MNTEDFYHTIIPLRDDLLRYAVSLTASSDDADDLAQETLLRLWDMRERLDAGDNLRAMAVTMLRNRFYDQQRHASHSRRLSAADDIGREDLRVEARDQIGLVSDIIDHLPPLQQRLFRMKEIEGYTADEIMRITGCSAANLRKNLSRARIAIRTQFIHITRQGGNNI